TMDSDAEAEEIASDEEIAGVDDDQAYSVDFDEDLAPSPVKPANVKGKTVSPSQPPAKPIKAVVATLPPKVSKPPPIVDDDDEEPDYGDDEFEKDDDGYGDASFENESGRASSPRHHVNLSVPTRPPSPPRAIEKSPPKPPKLSPAQLPPSPPLTRIDEASTNPPTREASRYIRQLETQLLDENDALKHQHAQLTRTNNDLKNELRFLQQRHVDEKRLRSEKFQQKKKRADERRLQHELVLVTTKQTLQEVEAKYVTLESAMMAQTQAMELLQTTFDACDAEKRVVEERHRVLSDKYQSALQDIHALNGKLEAAVDVRQHTQHKYEKAMLDHKVALDVVEQRCLVKLQCMQAMDKATAERHQERIELPENYRLIVEAQRERYEKLEEKLLQDKREMEDKATRERDRFDKALAMAQQQRIQAEERADAKIRDEAIKVFRERDAIDDQRRQLLTSLATQNARLDEERGKVDALRTQLEEKRLKLVQDEITVEAQAKQCHDRLLQLARDEDTVNTRKREVLALSASTLEKSRSHTDVVRALEQLQIAHAELQDKFNALSRQSTQQTADHDHKFQLVEREKTALERANAALGHEKLQLAKARMECRQMMEGTRKLDYLLRQQAALGNIYVHPPSNQFKPPPSWSVAFDADKEASMY
ncbi:hypothetical protein DYB36_009606, partial [Aphanomyces astaci]